MDDIKRIFAQNLIRLRTGSHMTQLELGARLNYSDKAVSRWERGEAVPDAYVLLQLAELFHVSVDALLHEYRPEEAPPAAPAAPSPRLRIQTRTITTIALTGVWTLGLLVFIVLFLLGHTVWQVFVYTLPVSLIVHVALNSIWGSAKLNLVLISLLCWSLLAALYLTFLSQNWWIVFLLGAPIQVIICLCFFVYRNHKSGKNA